MKNLEIKAVGVNDETYKEMLELRDEALRRPLGLSLFDEELDEKGDFHIAAISGGNLIGCLILTPLGKTVFKMRQVAVKDGLRGQGAGTQMVHFSERFAKEKGCGKITLNARLTAVKFYKRLGYSCDGAEFTEVGIPHIKMFKILEGGDSCL